MAYYLAAVHPDLFSTIIAISGRLDLSVIGEGDGFADPARVVALHGTSDSIVAYSAGKSAAAALTEIGREVRFIDLPGDHLAVFRSGHDIFKEVLGHSVE